MGDGGGESKSIVDNGHATKGDAVPGTDGVPPPGVTTAACGSRVGVLGALPGRARPVLPAAVRASIPPITSPGSSARVCSLSLTVAASPNGVAAVGLLGLSGSTP